MSESRSFFFWIKNTVILIFVHLQYFKTNSRRDSLKYNLTQNMSQKHLLKANPHETKVLFQTHTGQWYWSVYLPLWSQLVMRKRRMGILTPPCRGWQHSKRKVGPFFKSPLHNSVDPIKGPPGPPLWGWRVDGWGWGALTERGTGLDSLCLHWLLSCLCGQSLFTSN